jgi:integrase
LGQVQIIDISLISPKYVFCNKHGKKLTVLTNAFWKAVEEAGLIRVELDKNGKEKTDRFRFHDLRHTFGSRLGMACQDLKTSMEIMGHKNPRMAMRYQHPSLDHQLRAVKILDGYFTLTANAGWVAANLKPLRLRAYSQIVIKYAFC